MDRGLQARGFPGGFLGLVVALVITLSGCVHLSKNDAFPSPARVINLSGAPIVPKSLGDIVAVPITVGARSVQAYRLRTANSTGVLLFFGGSGNDTESQLRVLGPSVAALGLDLVVFSYYVEGESVPTVSEARVIGRAVYAATAGRQAASEQRVFLMGHSLGAWFALDVASNLPVAGLAVVGAATTATDVIRATSFWARLANIQADEDSAQLNSQLFAPKVTVRSLVVTSEKDTDVPASISKTVFQQLPMSLDKQLLVLQDASHATYFRDAGLWDAVKTFFKLPQTPVAVQAGATK